MIFFLIFLFIIYEIPCGKANTLKLNEFEGNVSFQIECRSILSKNSCISFVQCYYIETSSYSACEANPCHENNYDSSSTCSIDLNCINSSSNTIGDDEYCHTIKIPCIDCPQCFSDPICSVDDNVDIKTYTPSYSPTFSPTNSNSSGEPTSSPTYNPTTRSVELNYTQNFKGNMNELEQFCNASTNELNTLSVNGNTMVHLDPTFELVMKTLVTRALNISINLMIIDGAMLVQLNSNRARRLNELYYRKLQNNNIELQVEYTIISKNKDVNIISQVISEEASGNKLIDDMIVETQDDIKYGNNTSSWSFDTIEADIIENDVTPIDSYSNNNDQNNEGAIIGTIIGAFFALLLLILAILVVYHVIKSNSTSNNDSKAVDSVDTAYNKAVYTDTYHNANTWNVDATDTDNVGVEEFMEEDANESVGVL